MKIITFALLLALCCLLTVPAISAQLPEWDMQAFCEKSDNVTVCVENENAAKERLAKMDDAQELITMLSENLSPEEQSYALLEQVVGSMRKK